MKMNLNVKMEELKNMENMLVETLQKVIELMYDLKDNKYYLITGSTNCGCYHIKLQRTEFSKIKYISFIEGNIVHDGETILNCYKYHDYEFGEKYYKHKYTNEKLYKELIPLEMVACHRLSLFYDMFPEVLDKE